MTLPASGLLTLSQIRDELEPGDATALNLGFYVGRTYYDDTGTAYVISATPNMNEFHGRRRIIVSLPATYTIFSTFNGSGIVDVTATFEANLDGFLYKTTRLGGRTAIQQWLYAGFNSDYEIRATYLSGATLTSGTMSTWLGLGTTRTWSLLAHAPAGSGGVDNTSNVKIEIRRVSDGVVLTTTNPLVMRAQALTSG